MPEKSLFDEAWQASIDNRGRPIQRGAGPGTTTIHCQEKTVMRIAMPVIHSRDIFRPGEEKDPARRNSPGYERASLKD